MRLLIRYLDCSLVLEGRTICDVSRMEQFFGELTAWLAKVILVEMDDVRVVVRLTEGHLLVDGVEDVGPLLTIGIEDVGAFVGLDGWLDEWLTATVDAAAWAAHDLDEGVFGLAGADVIEQLLGILHARGDRDFDLGAFDVDLSFLDRF